MVFEKIASYIDQGKKIVETFQSERREKADLNIVRRELEKGARILASLNTRYKSGGELNREGRLVFADEATEDLGYLGEMLNPEDDVDVKEIVIGDKTSEFSIRIPNPYFDSGREDGESLSILAWERRLKDKAVTLGMKWEGIFINDQKELVLDPDQ